MRYLVHVRDSNITKSLADDNLRGESRWERQAAEALVQAGHQVHSDTGGHWKNNKPDNFHFGIDAKYASETVAITHDFHNRFLNKNYKACIFNIFSTHQLRDNQSLIQKYINQYGNRFILTYGYYNSFSQIEDLLKYVDESAIEFLGAPSAPYVTEEDSFNCKNLIWISRGVHLHTFPGRENPSLERYILWIKQKLDEDKEANFNIISGLTQKDMDWQKWHCTVEQRIFQSPIMQTLQPYRDRIHVIVDAGWKDILELCKKTKLFVSLDLTRWGGPPIESAMFGIPYVSP